MGHTDDGLTAPERKRLGALRALAVARYLARHGVGRDRMRLITRGGMLPVAPNDTAEGRAKNRRVQITIQGDA